LLQLHSLPKAAKSWFRHYLSGIGLLFVVSSVVYSVELDSEEKSVRSIGQVQESQKLKLKIQKKIKKCKRRTQAFAWEEETWNP
jgi:hypothetical protein